MKAWLKNLDIDGNITEMNSDLLVALSEAIDKHGKMPADECEQEQVNRWQGLAERIEYAGDWETTD